jgi:hypothetical protein
MAIQVDTIEGPAFLAPALINGDETGLSNNDLITLELFMKTIPNGWYIVDCTSEPYYSIWDVDGFRYDMLEYTIHNSSK